ncbi:hypothetical protein XENTR_v10013459 [Xenopus tropicalis]|nr:hypothetical protein XENTR_v10013459 [Xenopus tropicalis]
MTYKRRSPKTTHIYIEQQNLTLTRAYKTHKETFMGVWRIHNIITWHSIARALPGPERREDGVRILTAHVPRCAPILQL